jgi:hypothetical protein
VAGAGVAAGAVAVCISTTATISLAGWEVAWVALVGSGAWVVWEESAGLEELEESEELAALVV